MWILRVLDTTKLVISHSFEDNLACQRTQCEVTRLPEWVNRPRQRVRTVMCSCSCIDRPSDSSDSAAISRPVGRPRERFALCRGGRPRERRRLIPGRQVVRFLAWCWFAGAATPSESAGQRWAGRRCRCGPEPDRCPSGGTPPSSRTGFGNNFGTGRPVRITAVHEAQPAVVHPLPVRVRVPVDRAEGIHQQEKRHARHASVRAECPSIVTA